MKRITSLLILGIILLFPFGQLTRIPLPVPEAGFYLHDLLIVVLVLINIKTVVNTASRQRYFLGFILISLFSLFLSLILLTPNQVLISSLYLVRWIASTSIMFIIFTNKDIFLSKRLSPYLTLSIILSLLTCFYQYFFFPKLEPLYASGWDRHAYRLTGTWFDANFTALLLCLFFLWLLEKIRTEINHKKATYFYGILALTTLASILLTYSRSGYVAVIGGTGLFFILHKEWKKILLVLILLLFSLPFLPRKFGEGTKLERLSTVTARLENISAGSQLIEQRPIFGYGFDTLRYIKYHQGKSDVKWQITHSGAGLDNSFLFLLATTGIFGTFNFILFWKGLVKTAGSSILILSSLTAIFIAGMFANTWFYPWVMLWMYLLVGGKKASSSI